MREVRKLIDEEGVRLDGRRADELRPIKLEVGVLGNADGSAYIEQGRTKILAAVYGPRELHPKHLSLPDRSLLRCRYHMAPFSVETRKDPRPSRREIELSKVSREALEPALFLERFPRTGIDVFIEVLQADGGTRCAGISAASVALADAGLPMKDLVAACSVGKVDGYIVLDLMDVEDKSGQADMPVAFMPSHNAITLLQLNGQLTFEEFKKALELALNGCRRIYEVERDCLRRRYAKVGEEATLAEIMAGEEE